MHRVCTMSGLQEIVFVFNSVSHRRCLKKLVVSSGLSISLCESTISRAV